MTESERAAARGPAWSSVPDPGRATRRAGCALALLLGVAAAYAIYVLSSRPPGPLTPGAGPCEVRHLADELADAETSGDKLSYDAALPATQTWNMGETFLRSIVACPRQRIVFRRPLENPGRLDFDLAFLHVRTRGQTRPVRFSVEAVGEGGSPGRVLFSETLDPESDAGRWMSRSVRLAGEQIAGRRLALLTEPARGRGEAGAGEDFPTHLPVWGAPRLVSGGRPQEPNVVLVCLEGLRADKLGCAGGRDGVTPSIDELAARGLLAECVICPSPWPRVSLRSLLTGLSPGALALDEPNAKARLERYLVLDRLSGVMRRSGRTAAAFTGGGEAAAVFGPIRTFDRITEYTPKTDRLEELVERAAEFVERARHGPFFVFIHSAEVSAPWVDSRYAPKSPSARLKGGFGFRDGRESRGSFKPTPAEIEYARDLYDGDLAAADEAIGRLVEALRRSGALERTVIAVTSTCGAELFERDWWGSAHGMTDEFLRVPLVMAGPGVRGHRVTGPVRLERVAPAILRAAGVKAPLGGGRPRAIGPASDPVIVSGWPGGGEWRWAVRAGRWKLIAGGRDLAKRRLFDLHVDPGESSDIAPKYPGIAAILFAEIRRHAEWASRAAKVDPAGAGVEEYRPSEEAKGLAAPAGDVPE